MPVGGTLPLNIPDKHNILTPQAIAGLTKAAAALGRNDVDL